MVVIKKEYSKINPSAINMASESSGVDTYSNIKVGGSTTTMDPKTSPEEYTEDFLEFMYNSPTTFHAINNIGTRLSDSGFSYLPERHHWNIGKGQKFYTTRNGSSLLAVVIGENYKPGNGAAIIGAHIDALTTKVKPISVKEPKDGYAQIGIAPYAGALSRQWWDRDLGVAGRIIFKNGDKEITSKLVHIPHPIATIPSLAPHFGAAADGPFNKESQMVPVMGLWGDEPVTATEEEKNSPLYGKHNLRLLRQLSKQADISIADMVQVELEMFDTQHGVVGGLEKDLLFCPRIDDKICSFAAINGMLESLDELTDSSSLSIVALYDNEEIGSLLKQGAQGNLLEGAIDRILCGLGSNDELKRETFANSFFASFDVCHAVNPNFSELYLEHHKPKLNVGVGMYFDPNGHMTTDSVSASLVEEIARRTNNKVQYFQIRNDSRSGGTIGPYISSKSGMRAVDLGIPQLAMHSIRATTGSRDVYLGVKFCKNFYQTWNQVDLELKLGGL